MASHDPRKAIEDLRNHLAVHDRRLGFLLGSGTSSAINVAPPASPGEKPEHKPLIPGVDDLTQICAEAVSAIGAEHAAAWDRTLAQCVAAGKPANVEQVLSLVRMKLDAIGQGEELAGLSAGELQKVERAICSTIAKVADPEPDSIPETVPHDDFAAWVKKVNRVAPLEIFTTNYDILIERSFETARVPLFDGFVGSDHPFFYPECLDDEGLLPKPRWIRLWKIHGSINWKLAEREGDTRIIRGRPTEQGQLILPSHRKYDESRKRPYITYMDRLSRIMNSDHSLLITAGYSFRDDHVNDILFSALENKSTANVISLQFEDLDEDHPLVATATTRSNLTVIAPNGGVVAGSWGTWQLTQPVDARTHAFMDIAFDSNANPEEGGSPAAVSEDLRGRVRLGDFNRFCQFLRAMGG